MAGGPKLWRAGKAGWRLRRPSCDTRCKNYLERTPSGCFTWNAGVGTNYGAGANALLADRGCTCGSLFFWWPRKLCRFGWRGMAPQHSVQGTADTEAFGMQITHGGFQRGYAAFQLLAVAERPGRLAGDNVPGNALAKATRPGRGGGNPCKINLFQCPFRTPDVIVPLLGTLCRADLRPRSAPCIMVYPLKTSRNQFE